MASPARSRSGQQGDPTPVAGGCTGSSRLLRDVPEPTGLEPGSLDEHIATLLTLHPDIVLQFRSEDLGGIDKATKLTLLKDINTLLGIRAFRKPKP